MVRKTCTLFFILCLAAVSFAQSADEIIQKHIEAQGGLDKLQAIKSIKMSGKMTMEGPGGMAMEGQIIRQQKRPHFVRMDIRFQGQAMVQAYDGENAWHIIPFMGDPTPQPMPEDQAKQLIHDSDLDGPFVDYKAKGHKIEFVGKEDVEGTETYKLKVTLKDGDTFTSFLDSEYYLELKRIVKQKDRRSGNEIEAETFMSDFKEVNGVMMPHAVKIKGSGPGTINFIVDSMEVNVEMDESVFKMPAEEKKE
ncbi:MAG: outer membrane lipoprotein carrier protein LolA [bacterium]